MVSIGASGYVGIAKETTSGTYQAPTKFFPIRSESLAWTQDTNYRRVIRGTVDPIGAIAGNGNTEGDLELELLSDVLPYMLQAARGTITKTGAAAPFTYDFAPSHAATPDDTLSITVVRGGVAFGYVGQVVASMSFGVDNDMATVTFSMLGTAEESVAVPGAPVYAGDTPYGAGKWNIQIPTTTQVFDADGFSFEVDDSGEPQNRLKSSLGAQFVAYGERSTTLSLDRDFENRTEYDAFKNLTSKSITVKVENSASDSVEVVMPVSVIDSYDLGLSGVGDLVRASLSYMGMHDAGGAYGITVVTNEDVTV